MRRSSPATRSAESWPRPARSFTQADKSVRIERALAVISVEAEEAEDAQIIFLDALFCFADEAHASFDEIAITAERIEHGSVAVGIKCVQREVAPPRVLLPILREGDRGVPPICLDVASERRHLEWHAVNDHRHRAVLDPRRHGLEPGSPRKRHHAIRQSCRREVDLGDGNSEQRVAHRATHGAGRHTVLAQSGKHARDLRPLQPFSVLERRSGAL